MKRDKNITDKVKAARSRSVPLISIRTVDPANVIERIGDAIGDKAPLLSWDIVRAMRALNESGAAALASVCGDSDPKMVTGNPVEALDAAARLPDGAILFVIFAGRYVANDGASLASNAAVVQAVWNLRDAFKANRRTLIMLGATIEAPPEIAADVHVIDEALPDAGDIQRIVCDQFEAAKLAPPTDDTLAAAVDATIGLAPFPIEQATAMSLTRDGLDIDELWQRKRAIINATKGARVYSGTETFIDSGGLANLKAYFTATMQGEEPPRVIVFIDELEKAMKGAGGDTSGVSDAIHAYVLTFMADERVDGTLLYGVPGCGKSMICKALANEYRVPLIMLDVEGLKESFVGASGVNARNFFNMIKAIGQGRYLFVATANNLEPISPELRSRFAPTFFFDLPTDEERAPIVDIHARRYEVDATDMPDIAGWTGREIEKLMKFARRMRITPRQAAAYITPVNVADRDMVERCRNAANGRLLSTSVSGVYRRDMGVTSKRGARAIAGGGDSW